MSIWLRNVPLQGEEGTGGIGLKNVRDAIRCTIIRCTLYTMYNGRRNEEVVWRDGLSPGRVWPEVNVFLETDSQISDWSCVICHWLERWQQKKRCPRCDKSAVRNESSSQQLSLSYSPPPSCSLWTIYFSKLREKNCSVPLRFGPTPLSLSLSRCLTG